jgi:hypothetical protein
MGLPQRLQPGRKLCLGTAFERIAIVALQRMIRTLNLRHCQRNSCRSSRSGTPNRSQRNRLALVRRRLDRLTSLTPRTLRRCVLINPNACRFRYNLALLSFFPAHYDGQPVDAAAWTHGKPLEPALRGAKVVARSGSNARGGTNARSGDQYLCRGLVLHSRLWRRYPMYYRSRSVVQ